MGPCLEGARNRRKNEKRIHGGKKNTRSRKKNNRPPCDLELNRQRRTYRAPSGEVNCGASIGDKNGKKTESETDVRPEVNSTKGKLLGQKNEKKSPKSRYLGGRAKVRTK